MNTKSGDLDELSIHVMSSIHDIDYSQWDRCAGTHLPNSNPFVRHAFLATLEDSGSVTTSTGWKPQHLILRSPKGTIVGCAPLYLKDHSYGEYVFDWGWANAYERAGGSYYPKLQCSVPFTPATGPRLLVSDEFSEKRGQELKKLLLGSMVELADQTGVSSLHITFPTEQDFKLITKAGLLPRIGQQFHWKNEGYDSFDAFLDELSSRKRKNIRKEREKALESGVKIITLTGDEISSQHWDAFYRFYRLTTDRKWGQAYLSRTFFDILSERMGEHIVLIMGEENGELVCGALNLLGGNTLFGRNWGTIVPYPMLHFEICYYQAIDFAIKHKLNWVEAGAQGMHKIQRGYLPQKTFSAHWIADQGFRDAVERYLDQERYAIEEDLENLSELGPFKVTEKKPLKDLSS